MSFEVGDRVRVSGYVHSTEPNDPNGCVGEVVDANPYLLFIVVRLDVDSGTSNGKEWYFLASELERV